MANPKVRNTFLESYIPNTSISKTPFNSPVPEMTESLPEVPDNTIGREMPTKKLNSLPNCYFSGLDYDKQGHINNLTPQQTRYLYLTSAIICLLYFIGFSKQGKANIVN